MKDRIHNFSAGPAVLPLAVVEKVRENLVNYEGSGLGVMEMSHRGPLFETIIGEAEACLRRLLQLDNTFAVLFATGGATNQFSMVPMNLLLPGMVGDYIITGTWAEKAYAEAKKFGEVAVAASSEAERFRSIPKEFRLSPRSAYLHFTSNNTIVGSQFRHEPDANGTPLICDASSDFLHKPLAMSRYGLVYAGAQKNLGPAGVTIVIIRRDLLERCPEQLPIMLDYRTYTNHGSLYNTPPTFPIYVTGAVLQWIEALGGLEEMERRNNEKAALLYARLDRSDFYRSVVDPSDRSVMNVTFRIHDHALEDKFLVEAQARGLDGLQGHRSVGGMRASIYNAFPREGVVALIEFMDDFEQRFG
ncbi:MAG: 3-phosphoserine/phosphohydroxythreonine transaminase [Bdellovibrionales bacterium]|nr:3-phosphoserine/phosphohydroxythreonine transaminase [Bdellovibrionales bacterium]